MANQPQTSTATYGQIQQLARIFTPYAQKQRDEACRRQGFDNNATPLGTKLNFVHYTSAEAALRIINEKRLWIRNTNCMDDYREVLHGRDILENFLANDIEKRRFITALDDCARGAAQEAIDLYINSFDDTRLNTYITSLSEHDSIEDSHGRLSMWRAFGGDSRVAIVIGVPWFESGISVRDALQIVFSPVAYLAEAQAHDVIYDVIKNIGQSKDFLRSIDYHTIVETVYSMLLTAVTCVKHEGFREEREWRVIHSPKRHPSALIEHATQVIRGVPQIVYKLPLDERCSSTLADLEFSRMFKRLIIGPTRYPVPMKEAFTEALVSIGVPNPEVVISDIPIRA